MNDKILQDHADEFLWILHDEVGNNEMQPIPGKIIASRLGWDMAERVVDYLKKNGYISPVSKGVDEYGGSVTITRKGLERIKVLKDNR